MDAFFIFTFQKGRRNFAKSSGALFAFGKEQEECKIVEIYWDDLTEEKQREILEVFGDNQNFDQFPIAVLLEPEKAEDFYLS